MRRNIDFLSEPVRDQALLDMVVAGIASDTAEGAAAGAVKQHGGGSPASHCASGIFRRVMYLRLNKQIAFEPGSSDATSNSTAAM